MAETHSYQMAIDLLRCHLGMTEEEARQQLGLTDEKIRYQQASETQQALLGLPQDK